MAKQQFDKRAKTIELEANSNREFFLVHGFSGSPAMLRELGEYLHEKFNANVRIIRLKNHGRTIREIEKISYAEFLSQMENELEKSLEKNREIVIGGLSLGTLIALDLAARKKLKGVFTISDVYEIGPLVNLLGILHPIIPKKRWKKTRIELKEVFESKSYATTHINLNAYKMWKDSRKRLKKLLPKIKIPCLIIEPKTSGGLVNQNSAKKLKEAIGSNETKIISLEEHRKHGLILSPTRKKMYEEIEIFFKEKKVFTR